MAGTYARSMPMKRYILTGTPGAGKTALLRLLELNGYAVVEEAATDVIALAHAHGRPEPWKTPSFIDDIVALQRQRQARTVNWLDEIVVFDRSPICTWALCEFLGRQPPTSLVEEVERIEREGVYDRRVFFIENLGYCTPTAARRISFDESVRFEEVHAQAYRRFRYDCVPIASADISSRFEAVRRQMSALK
jgi:predicted ATPase